MNLARHLPWSQKIHERPSPWTRQPRDDLSPPAERFPARCSPPGSDNQPRYRKIAEDVPSAWFPSELGAKSIAVMLAPNQRKRKAPMRRIVGMCSHGGQAATAFIAASEAALLQQPKPGNLPRLRESGQNAT